MPELPEAETIAEGLKVKLVGKRINGVHIKRRDVLNITPQRLRPLLLRRRILSVERMGKKIILQLEGKRSLIFSLGMSGQLYTLPPEVKPPPHTHLIIEFSGLAGALIFRDPRRFGGVSLEGEGLPKTSGSSIRNLGPDILSISEEDFIALMGRKKRQLKALLLDQGLICGLGNIYTDESLFRARLHPGRRSDGLNVDDMSKLYNAIRQVLAEAISAGGSSISDYVDAQGEAGNFQVNHRVYGKEGEPCPNCGNKIAKMKIGGRGTHYCPHCQPG